MGRESGSITDRQHPRFAGFGCACVLLGREVFRKGRGRSEIPQYPCAPTASWDLPLSPHCFYHKDPVACQIVKHLFGGAPMVKISFRFPESDFQMVLQVGGDPLVDVPCTCVSPRMLASLQRRQPLTCSEAPWRCPRLQYPQACNTGVPTLGSAAASDEAGLNQTEVPGKK